MDIESNKKKIIDEIHDLPTLPVVMLKILECIDDPHSSAEDLKNIIMKDAPISAKVLKLANSAYYGYTRHISEITRAIVILGFEIIIDVAMSVSLASLLNPPAVDLDIPVEEFWKHSIGVGEAARLTAKQTQYPYSERAFLMGLTHDIGKIIFTSIFPREFNNALRTAKNNKTLLIKAEKGEIGINHTQAGELLCDKWELPKSMSIPVRYHHQPEKAPEEFRRETALVHLANYMVKSLRIGNSGDNNKIRKISPLVYSVFDLDEDDVTTLSGELEKLRPKIDAFMGSVF